MECTRDPSSAAVWLVAMCIPQMIFFQQKGSGKPSGVIPVCRGFSAAAK